jgi:hypothetical protein
MMRRLLPLFLLVTMNATTPDGGFLCGVSVTKIQKNSLPTYLGEALSGFLHKYYDFHGSGVKV